MQSVDRHYPPLDHSDMGFINHPAAFIPTAALQTSCLSPRYASPPSHLTLTRPQVHHSFCVQRRGARRHHDAVRMSYAANFPDPPDEIKKLDEEWRIEQQEYAARNANTSDDEGSLSKAELEKIIEQHPVLRKFEKEMAPLMSKNDYDVNDPNFWTWAYYYLLPWRPSRLLQFLLLCAALSVAYFFVPWPLTITAVQSFYALARLESLVINPVLVAGVPAVLLPYLLIFKRMDKSFDACARILTVFALNAMLLVAVSCVNATGNAPLAMVLGIVLRLVAFLTTLWYWRDLNDELAISLTPVESLIHAWRSLTTLFVVLLGSVLRVYALMRPELLPSMSTAVTQFRLATGARFPVACSLCNDPRGLYFMACLVLAGCAVYTFQVIVYTSNFGRINRHRQLNSPLSKALCGLIFCPPISPTADIYSSNNLHLLGLEEEETATNQAYMPSRMMMLSYFDTTSSSHSLVTDNDSGLLSNDLPILTYLDNEEGILNEEGASVWTKPHDELIPPLHPGALGIEDKFMKRLNSWAQPLNLADSELSFEEYFQTLREEDYKYDPDQDSWVFSPEAGLFTPAGDDSGGLQDSNGDVLV